MCLWETEEEGEGSYLWSYTETVRTPEAQERLETSRMQGLTWKLSCARSQPYTPMSCGLHHGEHAESLSPEVKEGIKACDMTQTSHTPPRAQRDERMKHPNRSLSQPNKTSRGKPRPSRKPSCCSPDQQPRRILTPGHVDPASVSAVVTHREHICKPQTSAAGLC